MKVRNGALRDDLISLERRIRDGAGVVPAEKRRAAADGTPVDASLDGYLGRVRTRPVAITDEEVAALRAAGHTDDAIFEVTVAAALGAAKERLVSGLAAIAAVYDED